MSNNGIQQKIKRSGLKEIKLNSTIKIYIISLLMKLIFCFEIESIAILFNVSFHCTNMRLYGSNLQLFWIQSHYNFNFLRFSTTH